MTTPVADETYGASYFAHSCGRPYMRDEHWLGFFGAIADRIVEDIRPRSVLDAGCAMGFLVEALRDRGVEAYGLDVSEYALGQVREDIRLYCRRASVTEPLDRDYDLIVSIEVLEHLPAAEAEAAIDNLCEHAGEILFSSTPSDFSEPTHVNVRPTSYWVGQFARRGFLADAAYDASYITAWARLFRSDGFSAASALEAYEQRLSSLVEEAGALRKQVAWRRDALSALESTWTFRSRRAVLGPYGRARRIAGRLRRGIRK